MSILSGRLVVTTAATLIVDQSVCRGGYTLVIQNLSNSKSIFLDGENVSVATGFELKKGNSITIPLAPDEKVYAISDSADTVEICYLVTKR